MKAKGSDQSILVHSKNRKKKVKNSKSVMILVARLASSPILPTVKLRKHYSQTETNAGSNNYTSIYAHILHYEGYFIPALSPRSQCV
jgi:hypothetical protein